MNSKTINHEIYKNCLNSKKFAYWVGVVQTDGYFKQQFIKSKKRKRFLIVLNVGQRSLPMQNKFREISQELFGLKGSLFKYTNKEGFLNYEYKFGCKNLIDIFNKFQIDFSSILSPPKFVLRSDSLFGAYIAGIIDGDGDVRISRPKYPQCYVRLSGNSEPIDLIKAIKSRLNCGVYSCRREQTTKIAKRTFSSSWQITEFIISNKNLDFIEKHILNEIALHHKRNKIIDYLKIKGRPPRIEFPNAKRNLGHFSGPGISIFSDHSPLFYH